MSVYAYGAGAGYDFVPGLPTGGGAVPLSIGALDSRYVGPGDPGFIGPLQPGGIPTTPDPEKGSWGDVLRGLGQTAGELLLQKYLRPSNSTPQAALAVRDKGELGAGIERNRVDEGTMAPGRSTGGIGLPSGVNGTWLLLGAVILGAVLIVRG